MIGQGNVPMDPNADPRIHFSLNGYGDGQMTAYSLSPNGTASGYMYIVQG